MKCIHSHPNFLFIYMPFLLARLYYHGGPTTKQAYPTMKNPFSRFLRTSCWAVASLVFASNISAQSVAVPGSGRAAVPPVPKKKIPEANAEALRQAEKSAETDAVSQAIYQIYGSREKLGPRADQILSDAVDHSVGFVTSKEVREQSVDNGVATVKVLLTVDRNSLQDFLSNYDIGVYSKTEGKFRVFTLAYTVEGGDPNRNHPPILHSLTYAHSDYGHAAGEVHDNREASASSTGYRNLSGQANSSASDSAARMAASGASHDGLFGTDDAAAVAAASRQKQRSDSVAVDATNYNHDAAEARQDAGAGFTVTNAASTFLQIVDYADPTKKGIGVTNEVRAQLQQILDRAGLPTNYYNLKLMAQAFETEDDLFDYVITKAQAASSVEPTDFLAIALNRLTPVPPGRRYTSDVVYRVIRVSDGRTLIPDENVTGDSGNQVSDDLARVVATQLAIAKGAAVLQKDLSTAMRRMEAGEARQSASALTTYTIDVQNVSSPIASNSLKDALRSAGFGVRMAYRAANRTEKITVDLNGHKGADAMAIIEGNLNGLDVSNLDERSAVLTGH